MAKKRAAPYGPSGNKPMPSRNSPPAGSGGGGHPGGRSCALALLAFAGGVAALGVVVVDGLRAVTG